jgi:hypothetical protein
MTWVELLEALFATVLADEEILEILGGPHLFELSEEREIQVPSIGYTLVFDGEEEIVNPVLVQWSLFGDPDTLIALEERLRQLVTARAPREIGGVLMRMMYDGGRSHPSPQPGVRYRSFDVRYESARRR